MVISVAETCRIHTMYIRKYKILLNVYMHLFVLSQYLISFQHGHGIFKITMRKPLNRRSQCPSSLRRRSTAVHLLRLWVRIPPGAWVSICECCVLPGRGNCDGLITRTEESYRLCCVVVCDLETSWMRPQSPMGSSAPQKNPWIKYVECYIYK